MSKPLPPTYRPSLPLHSLYDAFAGKAHWICHDLLKRPLSARTGMQIDTGQINNHAPLAVASSAVGQGTCVGIGFVVVPYNNLAAIDLDLYKPDHDPILDEFFKYARTFSEWSPSNGVHLLCRLDHRFQFPARHLFNQNMSILNTAGYCTITGRVDRHEPINDLSNLLERFLLEKAPHALTPVTIHRYDATGIIDNRNVAEIIERLRNMTSWHVWHDRRKNTQIGVRHLFEDTPENRKSVMLHYERWYHAECALINVIAYVTKDENRFFDVFAMSWLDRGGDLQLGTRNLFGQDRNHKPHCKNQQVYEETRLELFRGSVAKHAQREEAAAQRLAALRESNPHLFEGDTPLSKWIGTGGTFTLPNDRKAP